MRVGDLVSELSDCLGVYRDYTLDYEQLQDAIEEPAIKKQLQQEQDMLSHDSLRISSLLILPIQRVPRWVRVLSVCIISLHLLFLRCSPLFSHLVCVSPLRLGTR
jgi:RhoGEF domain